MASRKNQKAPRLEIIRRMPPLRHSFPDRAFNIMHSEVFRWLIAQPSVAQYLFDKAKNYMVYDQETGTWRGIDYGD